MGGPNSDDWTDTVVLSKVINPFYDLAGFLYAPNYNDDTYCLLAILFMHYNLPLKSPFPATPPPPSGPLPFPPPFYIVFVYNPLYPPPLYIRLPPPRDHSLTCCGCGNWAVMQMVKILHNCSDFHSILPA